MIEFVLSMWGAGLIVMCITHDSDPNDEFVNKWKYIVFLMWPIAIPILMIKGKVTFNDHYDQI